MVEIGNEVLQLVKKVQLKNNDPTALSRESERIERGKGRERGVPLNAVNGPVLVHYLVVLTGLQTS
jgi:hypothetical protein